jgi:hypothetical protein
MFHAHNQTVQNKLQGVDPGPPNVARTWITYSPVQQPGIFEVCLNHSISFAFKLFSSRKLYLA